MWEDGKKGEEAAEERNAAATMQEDSVKGPEGALQEKAKAMKKQEGVVKEEELLMQEHALKKHDKRTKPIRATVKRSAAGSSSSPQPLKQLRQLPPPSLPPHIHQLPDEVLEKIFALLDLRSIVRILSVCQRWRDMIEDQYLDKELVLEDGKIPTQEALCLIHSAQKLKSLDLFRRSDAIALLEAASTQCTNLLQLSVWACDVSASALTGVLTKVFQTNPHITDLRLVHFSRSEDLRFYQELGTALPDLRKLQFNIDQLSDLQLDALVNSCSRNQMEELKAAFSPCSEKTMAKLVQFWGHSLQVLELYAVILTDGALALLAGCSELRRLKLFSLTTRGNGPCGLSALSHLEELCVSHKIQSKRKNWCRFFSESRSSHALRKLCFQGWYGVDDRVLTSVAAFCPQLEELEMSFQNVTVRGVREVLQCCRKLHSLHVVQTNPNVVKVVPELPQLAPQLRRIRIGYDAKRSLGRVTLRRVQAQMPHLRID